MKKRGFTPLLSHLLTQYDAFYPSYCMYEAKYSLVYFSKYFFEKYLRNLFKFLLHVNTITKKHN